jgi:hypothetical protein
MLAVQRKFHEHFALISIRVSALQSALINEMIYKFHRTLMAKAELLGFDTLGASRFLAKAQELPDTVPELSKPTKARFRNIRFECFRAMVILIGNHWRRPAI